MDIEFICLGSGSSGNCYLLKKNDEYVMLECGFDWNTLSKKLVLNGLSVSQIKAVLITHEHKDHSAALSKLVNMGVKCYIPESEKLTNLSNIYGNIEYLVEDNKYELTSWLKMIPFSVCHDVKSFGFILFDTETKDGILFINDTRLFDFKYKDYGFKYIFIECNHIRRQLEAIMQQALDNGEEGKVFKLKRQSCYHLSLASCKRFLNKMNLSQTQAIFLMHLSAECSNKEVMRNEIQENYNIRTLVCEKDGGLY